jgi:hypothetical protein
MRKFSSRLLFSFSVCWQHLPDSGTVVEEPGAVFCRRPLASNDNALPMVFVADQSATRRDPH